MMLFYLFRFSFYHTWFTKIFWTWKLTFAHSLCSIRYLRFFIFAHRFFFDGCGWKDADFKQGPFILQAGQRRCGWRAGADEAAGHAGGRQRPPVARPARPLEPHQAGSLRGRCAQGLPPRHGFHGQAEQDRWLPFLQLQLSSPSGLQYWWGRRGVLPFYWQRDSFTYTPSK